MNKESQHFSASFSSFFDTCRNPVFCFCSLQTDIQQLKLEKICNSYKSLFQGFTFSSSFLIQVFFTSFLFVTKKPSFIEMLGKGCKKVMCLVYKRECWKQYVLRQNENMLETFLVDIKKLWMGKVFIVRTEEADFLWMKAIFYF